jgi:hypothetical protein
MTNSQRYGWEDEPKSIGWVSAYALLGIIFLLGTLVLAALPLPDHVIGLHLWFSMFAGGCMVVLHIRAEDDPGEAMLMTIAIYFGLHLASFLLLTVSHLAEMQP